MTIYLQALAECDICGNDQLFRVPASTHPAATWAFIPDGWVLARTQPDNYHYSDIPPHELICPHCIHKLKKSRR